MTININEIEDYNFTNPPTPEELVIKKAQTSGKLVTNVTISDPEQEANSDIQNLLAEVDGGGELDE